MTTALAFAAFADAPVDVAVVEVGLGGAEDATNVHRGRRRVITPIGLDHTEWLGDTLEDIALGQGRHHPQGRHRDQRRADRGGRAAASWNAAPRSARPSPARAASSACCAATVAVGGQVLTLQGLGGVYDEIFLPLHGAHQAQNAALALAAVEAFLGAGADRQLDVETVREGFAVDVARRAGWSGSAPRPTILLDGAHNPHGMAATVTALQEEFAFSQPGRRGRRARRQGRGRACSTCSSRWSTQVVVTRNTSPRAMPVDELAALAAEVFGAERVDDRATNMPDAIEEAVALAESEVDGELSGVGVLITGSVVTVADARRLLKR